MFSSTNLPAFGASTPAFGSSSSSIGGSSVFGQKPSFGGLGSSPTQTSPFGSTNQQSAPAFGSSIFGSSTPLGATSQSAFGASSTPAFGATSTPAFGSTNSPAFGATSTPAFSCTSTPAFGSTASPAFGNTGTSFGASNAPLFGSGGAFGASSSPIFGTSTAPAFGTSNAPAFGSSSPFGSTNQQSPPAFGSNIFGASTPLAATSQSAFGASSTQAFGATSTPAFGSTNSPAFGATSIPAFGATSTPAFGATSTPAFSCTSTPAFGSTASPAFGNTGTSFGASNAPVFGSGGAFGASSSPIFGTSTAPAFGTSNSPAFGTSNSPAFGTSNSPAFGTSSTPAFGSSSTSAFGSASTPACGASSTPSCFGSSPAFCQSASAFGSSQFGATAPFAAQSSQFGAQSTAPAFGSTGFGQSPFGSQRGGSRVAAFTPTTEADGGKLESISAMPVYKDESHEELRWEDYQIGDNGGPLPAGQPAGGIGFSSSPANSNPLTPSPTFTQSAASPFSTSVPSNPFAPKTPSIGGLNFGSSSTPAFNSSPFGASTSSGLFGSTSLPTSSTFGVGSSPSIFGSSPLFSSSQATNAGFGSNTQSSPLFQSNAPSIGQAGSAFGQTTTSFGQNPSSPFGQGILGASTTPGFGLNTFSSTSSLISSSNALGFGQSNPSFSMPFQPSQPAQTTTAFGLGSFGATQPAGGSPFGGMPGILGQSNIGQLSAPQSSAVVQPVPATNPFGTLPAMPQMSIGRVGTAPSIQYGISTLPVVDKPAPVRISSLLTSRHLSQRRIRLPARKYHTKNDGPKVPFFSDDEEPSTPKADALFIPRENPRSLVIRPAEQWPMRASAEKASASKDLSSPVHENGKISQEAQGGSNSEDKDKNPVENGFAKEGVHILKGNHKPNGVHEEHSVQKGDSYMTLSGHRAGEAAIVYEHGADIEALMPKLRRSDYYTEPRIQELAAKERAEPGFCRHVKDFVVGRHGFGSIKFLGETDVRRLDLEALVQFNNREVIVYMDDSKKPPVGQGLNKPAEVTLLNIKCFDKKTGKQYTEGPKIEKYKEMLKRKAEDQGAEFVSYDPIKGEWKFRVNHF